MPSALQLRLAEQEAAKLGKINLNQYMEEADSLLQEFRNKPTPPEYMQRNKRLLKSQKPLAMSYKAAKNSLYYLIKRKCTLQEFPQTAARIWFQAYIAWRTAFLNKKFFTPKPPDNYPYIYFPLHVDPEASTMVRSPMQTDQVAVIEALSKSAPADMLVVVKEHAPMLGLRPENFYKTISKMPKVFLLSPQHNAIELIKNSSLVSVITGTAAWEALQLGKPVLTLGDTPFKSIGEGLVHEPCLVNLPHAIEKALKLAPAKDETLKLYISSAFAESFEMPSSLLWGNYADHSKEMKEKTLNFIIEGIIKIAEKPYSV